MGIEIKQSKRNTAQGRVSDKTMEKLEYYSELFDVKKCKLVTLAVNHLIVFFDELKKEVESNVVFGGNMKDLFRKHMQKRTMNYATMPLKITMRDMPYEDRVMIELEFMQKENNGGKDGIGV